jgi:hypothetical protein
MEEDDVLNLMDTSIKKVHMEKEVQGAICHDLVLTYNP